MKEVEMGVHLRLDIDRTHPYLAEVIDQSGLALTKLERRLHLGEVIALSSTRIQLERPYDFKVAQDMQKRAKFGLQPTDSAAKELADTLVTTKLGFALCFDPIRDFEAPGSTVGEIVDIEGKLFYGLNMIDSNIEKICDFINENTLSWYFWMTILDCRCIEKKAINLEAIQNSKIMAFGAYDGEGYIFWQES